MSFGWLVVLGCLSVYKGCEKVRFTRVQELHWTVDSDNIDRRDIRNSVGSCDSSDSSKKKCPIKYFKEEIENTKYIK